MDNIYRTCRKRAAINNNSLASMEKAAEQLGISVSSLNQYELGITKTVPVDMVVLMSDVYNAPELRNHYCKMECPIGKRLPLATDVDDLKGITLRLLDRLKSDDIEMLKSRMVRIAKDGVVDDAEMRDFREIVEVLQVLATEIDELRVLAEQITRGGADGH